MLRNKRLFSLTGIATLLICGFACAQESSKDANKSKPQSPATEAPKASAAASSETISQPDVLKLSEAFGHFIGRNLKAPGVNFDLESIITGMRNGYVGKPAPMSDKEYEEMMTKMQEQAYSQLSSTNLKAANEFMTKNAKADKVVEVEPNKLQYIILKDGQGAVVMEHFAPQIKYSGKFLDGTSFGSSDEVGGAITIPLDQTIPGFSKGILGMKEGEQRRLFVHPDQGYGTTGHLPPNAMLIFDIEVIKANTANDGAAGADDLENEELDLSMSDEDDEINDDEDLNEEPSTHKHHKKAS
ncbi:MAG: FKBP-type peptidyl-prolyl cis-trans isomerase [Parachlamydiaceae bacterium]|nr:FKBP-type peptidyl-prolyl cis-trans isomerase [Parachlamydiaceae bacterium]